MKTFKSTIGIALFAIILAMTGCKSTRIVIDDPCEGAKYFTDDKFYRAKGIGESIDKATARVKGNLEATAEISKEVKTHIFEVTNRFTEEYAKKWDKDLQGKFISWVEQSTEMAIKGSYIICEKTLQYKESKYFEFHCVRETSKENYLNNLKDKINGDNTISQDEKDRINFDFEVYQKMYRERKQEYDNRLQEMLRKENN